MNFLSTNFSDKSFAMVASSD